MNNQSDGGLGLTSILTIIFVLAKIFGYVHFSWLICFLPVIISGGILLALIVVAMVITGIAVYLDR